jgi:hypothetical protein
VISTQSTVVASAHQVSSELGDEVVIMDLTTGVYHGLSSVGARAWSLVQQPVRVDAVRDRIMAEYDVDRSRCEADLLSLFDELKDKGLIGCRQPACADVACGCQAGGGGK